MGLNIFYDLHAPKSWSDREVGAVIERGRRFALEMDFQSVSDLDGASGNFHANLHVHRSQDRLGKLLWASPTRGWLFSTWPGKGCESAWFGLGWFPATVNHQDRPVRTGWGESWHFHWGCKTQYADLLGRSHFLKCHLGIVAMLDHFKQGGLRVRVRDQGQYWHTRSEQRLLRKLDETHALVAAVTGAIKDAAEGPTTGKRIAPISQHRNFELLEAKGRDLIRRKNRTRD